MPSHPAAAQQHDHEQLRELRALERNLFGHTGPGPTRIIPARDEQTEPPVQADGETGEQETAARPGAHGPILGRQAISDR